MSQNAASRFVVLQNPISNEGHLDSWHVLLIHLLREAGFKIIALTSDSPGLLAKLKDFPTNIANDVIVLSVPQDGVFKKSALRLVNGLQSFVSRLSGAPRRKVTHFSPAKLQEELNWVLRQYPGQIQTVFSLYIDAYAPEPTPWRSFRLREQIPLFGLCITPDVAQTEGYYACATYAGTCFLDEDAVKSYRLHYPDKHFEYLPDITDTRVREDFLTTNQQVREIQSRARGRKIVFMGGSIGKQKNLVVWHDVVRASSPQEWFFVQIGRINRNNLTLADEASLKRISANTPENLYVYDDYLADERQFNEIIASSDVIFAVYRDFTRSSNMLSKAAWFRKPVLVSQEGLMGERVSRFKIGSTVIADDVNSIISGLNSVVRTPGLDRYFEGYRQIFSHESMQTTLVNFLQLGRNPIN
jgi:hypothetical protein